MSGAFNTDFNVDFDIGEGIAIDVVLLPAANTVFLTGGLVLAFPGFGPVPSVPSAAEWTQGKYRPTTWPSASRPWKY